MNYIYTLIFILVGSVTSHAQGMEFFHGTWTEAKAEADKQGKAIFVDAYTTWCGPCKRMAKNIFTLPEVGDFYNQNFINFKIDMESEAGIAFGKEYPVRAYPTLIITQPNGDVISKTVGGKDGNGLIALGKEALKSFDGSSQYAEKYEKGDRSFETVYAYVSALNAAKKPSLKIANDFLDSKPELTEEQYYKFLLEATTEADSKLYEEAIKEHKLIEKYNEEDKIHVQYQAALERTATKAAEFDFPELLEDAFALYQKKYKNHAAEYRPILFMNYYNATNDVPSYSTELKAHVMDFNGSSSEKLERLFHAVYKSHKTQSLESTFISLSNEILGKKPSEEEYKIASNYAQKLGFNSYAKKLEKK